ncbi:hypothetical protein [Stenotrophomonas mori]|uniref:Transmembrane protein n=1 Tax=Stenotrophomonas mori TaxID=2871096 RepID=A0ABT0SCL2_9GAMM|nr:hypothetical protein [Stenotrophomonas mori]MCL7713051.1 hypothetical protein [Stenotrophomonas mori]
MTTVPPPAPAPAAAGTDDAAQLRLLSIFHYVVAALTGLFSLFPVLHLVMGLAMVSGRMPSSSGGPELEPQLVGWIFVVFAAVAITLGLALAASIAYAGRCLARRRRHTLCLVVAGLSCLLMPFGTVLGVFTLVVLLRPSVKAAFA